MVLKLNRKKKCLSIEQEEKQCSKYSEQTSENFLTAESKRKFQETI